MILPSFRVIGLRCSLPCKTPKHQIGQSRRRSTQVILRACPPFSGPGLGPPEAVLPEAGSPWDSAPSAARGALPMTPLAALTQAGCCLVILHEGWFCPVGHIWQWVETCLAASAWGKVHVSEQGPGMLLSIWQHTGQPSKTRSYPAPVVSAPKFRKLLMKLPPSVFPPCCS